ncbi:MAG TPA: AAA family ATPase, partial [Gemmataceae bacterium]|nr:AAA family ATPase [Gemmataceae bacterium]
MSTADAAPAPDAAALDDFYRRVSSVNPFLDNRVSGPAPAEADVAGIHEGAFARLTGLAREALAARRAVGAVLWGEAGVGKSHLLARLGRWAEADGRACFVYLHNLQAAPEHLPRSLLHAVVSTLTRGRRRQLYGTPLYELAHAGVVEAVGHDRSFYTWDRLECAFGAFLDRQGPADLTGPALIDRGVFEVAFRLFRSAYRQCQGKEDGAVAEWAARWLGGQALGPDEARGLGLPPSRGHAEPVALADNQQVKQVLAALARLAAAAGRPFVLAFDQVDNLDDDQAAALARFLEALIDAAPNLLVVTAGVQATLLHWREGRVIQESVWDRLAQFEVRLQRLNAAEALEVVRARLRAFRAPFAEVGAVRLWLRRDELYPLGRGWYERHLRDRVDLRPRDVINWAREGWRAQQEALAREGGPDWLANWTGRAAPSDGGESQPPEPAEAVIDRKVGEKVAERRARRAAEPAALPADADHLVGLLRALLVQCRDARRYGGLDVERVPPRAGARPTYDLTLRRRLPDGGSEQVGILAVTEENAVSVAASLRRLVEDGRPLDRVVLVTDERVGLPLGERGQDYLQELRERGPERFEAVELSFAEYAELDALQAVVGDARSGDLEAETGRALTEQEVIDSHHRRGRYLACRLLRRLLAPEGERPPGGVSSLSGEPAALAAGWGTRVPHPAANAAGSPDSELT